MAPFRPTRLLVTGGAGFIGSHFVAHAVAQPELESVVVLDALTYAGHRVSLDGVAHDPRFSFVHGDVCDREFVEGLLAERRIDAVVHLAAESHVDRSIEEAGAFVRTNVVGTFTLVDAAERVWRGRNDRARLVHVSTDEVYGSLAVDGRFAEGSPYAPTSPYAASKAGSDLIALAFFRTHGVPVVVTGSCNNYGPRQLPEKLVPLMIERARAGQSLPLYGDGKHVREWLHVVDHAGGLWAALTRGRPGERYNFGGGEEVENAVMVERICDQVDAALGRAPGTSRRLVTHVRDRKGHDFRYALDASKARGELGWSPTRRLADGLVETVRWYLANDAWLAAVRTEEYRRFVARHYDGAAGGEGEAP